MKLPQVSFPIQTNKLFFRILLYFLSLLIPILIIGAVFYVQFIAAQEQNFSEKITSNLKSSAHTIDIYLRTTQEVSIGFFKDYNINRLLKPERLVSFEDRPELPLLFKTLANYTSVIIGHIDKSFVFVDNKKVITNEGIDDLAVFFDKVYPYENYPLEFWIGKLNYDMPFEILPPSGIRGSGKGDVVPFVTAGYVNRYRAVMVNNMSVKTIEQTIRNNALFDSTAFFVTDHEGRPIVDTALFLRDKSRIVELFHDEERMGRFEDQSQTYVVSYVKSGNFGWRYYAITPELEFQKHAGGLLRLIVSICLALILVGFGFSVVFSSNLYTPIKRIRDILVSEEEGPEPAHRPKRSELDFIDSGVHQLLRHKHTFRRQLKELTEQYTDHVIVHLLNGNRLWKDHGLHAYFRDNLGFTWPRFLCCCLKFDFTDAFYRDIQDVDRLMVVGKLKNVISGLLNGKVNAYAVEYKPNLYAVVVNLNEDRQHLLQQALTDIAETFRYDSRYCSLQIGIGKMYPALDDIAQSCNEALTAIDNAEQTGQPHIVNSAQISILNRFYYSFLDESKIVNFIKAGDLRSLTDTFDSLIRTNRQMGASHHFIHLLLAEFYNTGMRYAADIGMDTEGFLTTEEQYVLSGKTDSPRGIAEKLQLLRKFYECLTNNSEEASDHKSSTLVAAILTYIEENYASDLYLEKIAEKMGLSAKYISKTFKEKTGVNLSDHINQFRIAKAKELLLRTDLNVNEISEQVGIFSRTTFVRLFKKFAGVTPLEFRKISRYP